MDFQKEARKIDLVQCWNVLHSEYLDLDSSNESRKNELLSKMSEIDTELYNDYGFEMF